MWVGDDTLVDEVYGVSIRCVREVLALSRASSLYAAVKPGANEGLWKRSVAYWAAITGNIGGT